MQLKISYIIGLMFFSFLCSAQEFKIGIITDFNQSENLDNIVNQMVQEIDKTTGSSHRVKLFSTEYGIQNKTLVDQTYLELKNQVDLVLAIGNISTKQLSQQQLDVPVIGLGIIDPILQDIPYKNGVSGKENFTYIWQTQDVDSELKAFRKIKEFKNLSILVDAQGASTINSEKAQLLIDSIKTRFEAGINIIPVGQDVKQALEQIPEETDAVYFTVMLSQSGEQLEGLIEELNQLKIPTFTGNSRLLNLGILGSMTNESDLTQAIRKLGITVDGIITGSDLAAIPVKIETKENLYVNLATARQIDLPIPFEVLFTATLIGEDDTDLKTYSFSEIAEKSLAVNLSIQISYQDLEQSILDVKSVRANLLPNLEAGVTASQINEERASAAFNTPEKSLDADLTLTQLIYSEQAIAGLKISKYLQKSQEYNTEAQVLSVLFDTYNAYLNVLSAKTNVQIQQENLASTKRNKELAIIRVNIGSSSNADLYRWESELAIANQSVIDAQTGLIASKLQLNTLLANTLESEYDIADVGLDDEWFNYYNNSALSEMLTTPESLMMASDFLVAESQQLNPNKKSLIEAINASNRQLEQNKRLLYIPTVAFQAQTSQVLGRGGAGSTIDQQAMALGITEFQDNSWFAGVSLTYPIFSGQSRRVAIQQSKVNLDQLGNSSLQLDQNLELGVRSSVLNLLTASTNIKFSTDASQCADRNFDLVQDNYKQGQVTITQLIDAQQAALQARLSAELSVYQFIQTHLQLEFNIGAFTMFMSAEQLQDFNNRLQNHLSNQN